MRGIPEYLSNQMVRGRSADLEVNLVGGGGGVLDGVAVELLLPKDLLRVHHLLLLHLPERSTARFMVWSFGGEDFGFRV